MLKVMVFHLNRLIGDVKLGTPVRFPLAFDLSPFMADLVSSRVIQIFFC